MNCYEYSASGTKLSFWFMEFRKVVSFLSEGKDFDEIRELNKTQNIFGAPSASRADLIFRNVAARIKELDKSFYDVFMTSDIASQKLFALAAVMAHDTLFFEFVHEVIREKMIIGISSYTDADVRIFFKNKQIQSEQVAGWSDETLSRLGRYYKNMLFEAGMTDKGKETRKIRKPILDPVVKRWLCDYSFEPIVKAIMGVR